MNHKRIPLRLVFLSVGMVFIVTALILQYLVSGEPLFSLPGSKDLEPSLVAFTSGDRFTGDEDLASGNSGAVSDSAFEENPLDAAHVQSDLTPSVQGTSESQVVQLVIPELDINASAGSLELVPWEERDGLTGDGVGMLGNSSVHYLQIDPQGESIYLNPEYQNSVNVDAIRDMLGLGINAQFTVINLSSDYLLNASQMEPESGQQPIVIMLDDARWILPESGGSFQIATSWPDELGPRRFVIVAKPLGEDTNADALN